MHEQKAANQNELSNFVKTSGQNSSMCGTNLLRQAIDAASGSKLSNHRGYTRITYAFWLSFCWRNNDHVK